MDLILAGAEGALAGVVIATAWLLEGSHYLKSGATMVTLLLLAEGLGLTISEVPGGGPIHEVTTDFAVLVAIVNSSFGLIALGGMCVGAGLVLYNKERWNRSS